MMAAARHDMLNALVMLARQHGWYNVSAETSDGRIVLTLASADEERMP